MKFLAYPALAAALMSMAPAANASSCVNPKVVQIQFAKGSQCWTYSGDATHFSGNFRAGQRVIATSTGIANFADANGEWKTTTQRDVDVSGPRNFYADMDDGGDAPTRLPSSGLYKFGFSPCAMWRSPGSFVVCTR